MCTRIKEQKVSVIVDVVVAVAAVLYLLNSAPFHNRPEVLVVFLPAILFLYFLNRI